MENKCKHDGGYMAIGQNTVSMTNGVVVITSTACAKCGEDVKVKATQIPFVMPPKEKKIDLMIPQGKVIK